MNGILGELVGYQLYVPVTIAMVIPSTYVVFLL